MTEYFVDAFAWVEYLEGSRLGEKVKKIVEENRCFTSAVSLAEVVSKAQRTNRDPQIAFEAILVNSRILPVNEEAAFRAGMLHARMREKEKSFGLADAFLLAQRTRKQRILTGDPHFRNVENVEFLK